MHALMTNLTFIELTMNKIFSIEEKKEVEWLKLNIQLQTFFNKPIESVQNDLI